MNVEARISRMFDHLANRLGRAILYRRFRSSDYDPVSGEIKSFWEEASGIGLVFSVQERSFTLPEEVAAQAEAILAFPLQVFTRQPGEPQEPWPHPGDEILIDGELWVPNLNGRAYAWTDPTKTLYFLAIRKA